METPQFYNANPNPHQFTPEKRLSDSKTDPFIVDDLLDLPTDDVLVETTTAGAYDVIGTSTDSSTPTVDSCNSSSLCGALDPTLPGDRSFLDTQLSNLCVPYDDLAEFEWLSNFVEESFSNEDLQKLQIISGVKAKSEHPPETHQFQPHTINRTNNLIFNIDMAVPSKARTKRSRTTSCNWASRPVVPSPTTNVSVNSESNVVSNSSVGKKCVKTTPIKKEHYDNSSKVEDGRKCLHCATDKTPQWRSGPMGPKTLCNACGVRYKSGRLVPEYRPAASPTFVLTKHSNSHRKVLELRRQKEMQMSQHHQQQFLNHQNIMLHMSNGDDYLIHQHIGHDYRQLI